MTQMRGVFKPAGGQPIEVPIAVDSEGVVQVSGGPGGGGPSTADALLADIKTQLQQVYGAIDGLELITGNINIDAGTMNLAVDGVEGGLAAIEGLLKPDPNAGFTLLDLFVQIRNGVQNLDLLVYNNNLGIGSIDTKTATIESLLAAEGADVALMQTALSQLKGSIESFQAQATTDLNQLKADFAEALTKLNQIYGSTSNIDSSLATIEQRTRPLIFVGSEVWGAGDGEYFGAAQPWRAVKVINNTGEANGRNAGTLFIAYNGNVPDRINHVQLVPPGTEVFLDCPALEFRIVAEGFSGLEGTYTVVRFE